LLDSLLQEKTRKTMLDSFWVNKCDCADAERIYYEKLAVQKSEKASSDAETQVCSQLSAGTGYKLVYPEEWTFKLTVPNFSSLKDPVFSEPCIIGNLPWKIKITKTLKDLKDNSSFYIGFFLLCDGVGVSSTDWSCYVDADLRLINQRGGKDDSAPIHTMFYSKNTGWGYPEYRKCTDVEDPDKGFIKDGSVEFEVRVKTDAEFVEKKRLNDKKDYVKIDFELNHLITRKGVNLSPSIKFGNLWWRFRLESSKKVTDEEEGVIVGVFLVCEGLYSQGGGAKWSCEITGKVELVNQLDSDENKVEHFANRKLDYKTGSLSFFDMISVEQIKSIKNGSFLLKARVMVVNFQIIQSDRYAKMLERRKGKMPMLGGGNEEVQVMKQLESNKTKKPPRRKQAKTIVVTAPAVSLESKQRLHSLQLPPIWTEVVSSVPATSSYMFYVKIQGVEQEILVRWAYVRQDEAVYTRLKKIMELLGKDRDRNVLLLVRNVGWDGEVQLVQFTDQKENNFGDLPNQISFPEEIAEVAASDESEQFKQDLCQSLNPTAVGEEMLKHVEENKTVEGLVKKRRRKRTITCYRPSCTETASHRCSRCLSVSYCSQGCNEQHWAVHREQCRNAAERDRETAVD